MTSTSKQPSSTQEFHFPSPLTTIFTPPVGCFDQQGALSTTTWHGCLTGFCYWTLPAECYPPDPYVVLATISKDSTTVSYPGIYAYSPGILPSGFATVAGAFPSSDAILRRQVTTSKIGLPSISSLSFFTISASIADQSRVVPSSAIGCLSGWTLYNKFLCGTQVLGDYVTTGQTAYGPLLALLPHIQVFWNTTDLPNFEPTSAPLLGSSLISSYEYKEAQTAASLTTIASTSSFTLSYQPTTINSTLPSSTTTGQHTSSATPSSSSKGLSTGAKAGIGVGAAVGALALVLLCFLILRNRRKHKEQSEHRSFVDPKPELSGDEKRRSKLKPTELAGRSRSELPSQEPQELEANNDPQEIATVRSHIVQSEAASHVMPAKGNSDGLR